MPPPAPRTVTLEACESEQRATTKGLGEGEGKGIQRTWLAEAEKARFWTRLKERRAANILISLTNVDGEKRREGEEGEKGRDWVPVRESPQLLPPSRCSAHLPL